MEKCNLKYSNNYSLIFQVKQEICLGSYNSKRHDTFIRSISTPQVNRTGNILQDAVFCNHKEHEHFVGNDLGFLHCSLFFKMQYFDRQEVLILYTIPAHQTKGYASFKETF